MRTCLLTMVACLFATGVYADPPSRMRPPKEYAWRYATEAERKLLFDTAKGESGAVIPSPYDELAELRVRAAFLAGVIYEDCMTTRVIQGDPGEYRDDSKVSKMGSGERPCREIFKEYDGIKTRIKELFEPREDTFRSVIDKWGAALLEQAEAVRGKKDESLELQLGAYESLVETCVRCVQVLIRDTYYSSRSFEVEVPPSQIRAAFDPPLPKPEAKKPSAYRDPR